MRIAIKGTRLELTMAANALARALPLDRIEDPAPTGVRPGELFMVITASRAVMEMAAESFQEVGA